MRLVAARAGARERLARYPGSRALPAPVCARSAADTASVLDGVDRLLGAFVNVMVSRRARLRPFADDLLQDARLTALMAVDRLDPARGNAATYLGTSAELALRRIAKRYSTLVHVPAWVWARDRENVFLRRALSRPAPFATGDEDARGAPEPEGREEDPAAVAERREEVEAILGAMTPLEREVLERRYGLGGLEPQGYGAIAAALETTRDRARSLHVRALARARRQARVPVPVPA